MSNDEIVKILDEYDSSSNTFSEHTISDSFRSVKDVDKTDYKTIAELIAFDFSESSNSKSSWGTYFGPLWVCQLKDGSTVETPSIKSITTQTIEYWEKRAWESKHPILKARYADLVWDFSKTVIGKNADYKLAQLVIDNNIIIADRNLHKFNASVINKLSRALNLSISIKDPQRIDRVKEAIISFEQSINIDNKPGTWGISYRILIKEHRDILNTPEEENIINNIEKRLERLCTTSETGKVDPWAIEAASTLLAEYYKTKDKKDDIRRVLKTIEDAFDTFGEDVSPILINANLERLFHIYRSYQLDEEAKRISIKIQSISPKIMDHLKPFSLKFEIPQKEIDEFIANVTTGNIEAVFTRIVTDFTPRRETIEKQLSELSKETPLLSMIKKSSLDYTGRTVAMVGSLENDMDGNIIAQISQNLSFESLFLRQIFDKLEKEDRFNIDSITHFLFKSPLFDNDRKTIITKGLDAYFNKDFIVYINLVIPQIEYLYRHLIELLGGSVLEPSRSGGFHIKVLDKILRDVIITNIFGQDASLYFRMLLTDPRGWNIRNSVCHGLYRDDMYTQVIADRLIHILLYLGLVSEK